jgi:hypothetical protein
VLCVFVCVCVCNKVCVCVTRAKITPMRVLKVSKETYRGKIETNYRPKRPTTEAKETYYRGKRDILLTASAAWTMSRYICSCTQMKEGKTTSCEIALHEPACL